MPRFIVQLFINARIKMHQP